MPFEMPKLFITRHGDTAWTESRRRTGRTDIPLNAAGEEHASVGIRVDLPFEQEANSFVDQVFEHRTFFSRLHHFVLVSDAFVVVPGGIGTALATMMVRQLLQIHKLHETPLILIGEMRSDLVIWAKNYMLRPEFPLASPHDLSIPMCCRSGSEILDFVKQHHGKWQAGAVTAAPAGVVQSPSPPRPGGRPSLKTVMENHP